MAGPTIIVGHLNDKELTSSIDALVAKVNTATQNIKESFDKMVRDIKSSMSEINNVPVAGSNTGSGTTRRAKEQESEARAVKETATSYDQLAQAKQKAAGSNIMSQYDAQLEKLRARLVEVRQDIDIFNEAIGSGKASQVSWGQEGLRQANQEAERLMVTITRLEQQRGALSNVVSPQGHTIQNYVNSLTKANPELARLNEQFKRGQSLLQNGMTLARQNAQAQVNGAQQSRASVEALNNAIARQGQYYADVRNQQIQNGTIALENASKIKDAIHQQVMAGGNSPIMGMKELVETMRELNSAYYAMDNAGRQSPLGQSLKEEYELLNKVRIELRKYNMELAGISRDQNVNVARSKNLEMLSNELKTLTAQYRTFDKEQRQAASENGFLDKLQRTSREIQKIQSQMSRPTSMKNVLGLDEKTLDDIQYKMRQLQSYRMGINITDGNGLNEIKQLDAELGRLSKQYNNLMGQQNNLLSSNRTLARSWNYMKNRLAFYLTIGASTQFVRQLVDIRSQYELLERSIGILVDSMQQGKQIFSELNAMALKSPFTTMELGAAAKQLVAYDIAAKDVVDTTKRLADMAAAVGIPVERLTYALGQVKAYGYLNARDARMFANAGIPLVKELADKYTELEGRLVSTADVYDRIKKKAVSFEDVMETVNKMTDEGGKFFNFQEKAADTLRVKIANLTLAYNNFLNELGQEEQGLISGTLGGIKTLLENWRAIDKAIKAIAVSWGITKGAMLGGLGMILAAQKLGIYHGRQITREMGMQAILGKRLGGMLGNIGASIAKFATNPLTWVTAAIASIAYLVFQYHELQKANDAFNKSIQDNSDENIKSIDKFFEDYKDNLNSIGGEGIIEQQKMWEKIQDEIEKVTKNSDGYVEILEQISDYTERIGKSEAILEQSKIIDEEVKRLAGHGVFDLGGGFADEDLAKDLRDYEKYVNKLTKVYASINAVRAIRGQIDGDTSTLDKNLAQANDELDKFVSKLDQANIEKIMGDSGDREIMLANLREYASIIRDNFLQTEQGQKISIEGQAKLNKWIDEWIASKGKANNLIGEERRQIESNRTAWELFFNNIRGKDRETLDYIIRTNKYGSEEFKKIWDKAAKNMAESSMTSYDQIQQQIKDLRDTPDIVIKVIYKEEIKKGDAQQQQFVKDLMTPDESKITTPKEYMRGVRELTKKFGRFQKKEGEDNVEWEKRLGETYRKNAESIGKLNKQLKDKEQLQAADREQKEKELQQLKDEQEALSIIQKREHFDYSKTTTKGGAKKDAILELLKQEIDLVKKLQSEYDKLTKKGETRENAAGFVESQYENTIKLLNAKLTGIGLPTIDASIIRGNKNDTLEFFKQLAEILESKGLSNLERMKAVEGVIREFSMAIKEENLDKIAKGLNNELGKLKDEYELGVELDANPELGEALLDMFGIDDSTLSSSIDDYMEKVQLAFNKAKDKLGYNADLNVFLADEKAWKEWGQKVGLNDEALEKFKSGFVNAQGVVKKWAENTVKQTKDLQYKLADINEKIAFEETKLANLKKSLAEETNEYQKKLLEEQIKDQELTIAKLKEEILEMLPTYKKLFGNLAEHSAFVTRRLAANYQKMLKNAKQNSDGTYTVTDPQTGQSATLTKKRYEKELDRANGAMLKAQTIAQKIGEAFTKGKDDVIDFVEGINLLGEEFGKIGDLVGVIGNIAESIGADENTVEIINDISASMQGLGTASQGISKIMNGDIIGGLTDVVKGLWDAISTWFDNSDKKILRQIEASENAVKDLELAYKDLEYAMNKAYGTAEIQAKQLVITNKELQLAELERQLALQESRKSKNRDEDAIRELKGQIKDLKYDIKDSADDIVNSLLGISGVGDAVENMVSVVTDALRNGEDAMESWNDSIDEMIVNMIKKFAMTYYLGPRFQKVFDDIQKDVDERSKPAAERLTSAEQQLNYAQEQYDKYSRLVKESGFNEVKYGGDLEKWRKKLEEAQREYNDAQNAFASTSSGFTRDDLRNVVSDLNEFRDEGQGLIDFLTDLLGEFGLLPGQNGKLNLSALQQGIQGITEDQASALEAYWNANTQQQYLQSDLLTQIKEAVVTFDIEAQTGIQAQMLLQLQQSYQVQQSIENILNGALTPSGRAFSVELIS